MLDNKKLLVTVTVVALAGVLGLFLYSTTIQPLELEIGEIDASHAGSIIRTSGTVMRASTFSDGSMSLTLGDFNESASIPVYFPSDVSKDLADENLLPGTQIRVQGEVTLYQESVELSVSRADAVSVISEANGTQYELRTVMGSIPMFDGMNVTTSGELLEIQVIYSNGTLIGTSFQLMQKYDNQTYYLSCMCFDRDISGQFKEWDAVRVTGSISFYTNRGCWQMAAEVISPS